jgi:hypothetical protein
MCLGNGLSHWDRRRVKETFSWEGLEELNSDSEG